MPKQTSGDNTTAEPMLYERFRMPRDLMSQRAAAASQVDGMSLEDLKRTAAELQVNTAGASTKEALSAAIVESARPINVE